MLEICPTTGRGCLYLTAALTAKDRTYVRRDDGSINLDLDEQRMRETMNIIETGQTICTQDECGVLANANALSIQAMIAQKHVGQVAFRSEQDPL